MYQVSKLQGASGVARRPEISPYVLPQMLVPLEMLLCGILMGFVALLAEIKGSRKSRERRRIEKELEGEEKS